MISVCFQDKSFNVTVIQVYAPTIDAEEAEVEWFYEDLQDLLELTPQKDVLFIIGDWNAKIGSQEIPGVTGNLPCFILYFKAKFACYPRCFLTFYFCIPVPYNEKDILFWVSVLEGLVGLHRTVELQLL